ERKAATDRWMIILTGAVAVATFLQFWALCIAIRTTRRQLRAYIQVDTNPNNAIAVDPTQIATLPVSIKNSGQTPAYDVEINGRILTYDYPLIGELPAFSKSHYGGRIVIQPGQVFGSRVAADRLWSDEDISRFRMSDNSRLFAYGLITYRDTFGKTRRTRFRL